MNYFQLSQGVSSLSLPHASEDTSASQRGFLCPELTDTQEEGLELVHSLTCHRHSAALPSRIYLQGLRSQTGFHAHAVRQASSYEHLTQSLTSKKSFKRNASHSHALGRGLLVEKR